MKGTNIRDTLDDDGDCNSGGDYDDDNGDIK